MILSDKLRNVLLLNLFPKENRLEFSMAQDPILNYFYTQVCHVKIFFQRTNSISKGFVLRKNRYDFLKIQMDFPKARDSLSNQKRMELLKALSFKEDDDNDNEFPLRKTEYSINELLCFFRVFQLEENILIESPVASLVSQIRENSNDFNGEMVSGLLYTRCRELLSAYSTTMEEDSKLLSKLETLSIDRMDTIAATSNRHLKWVILLRMLEKDILHYAINFLSTKYLPKIEPSISTTATVNSISVTKKKKKKKAQKKVVQQKRSHFSRCF